MSDPAADAIIRRALEEEEAQKKLRKSSKLRDVQAQKAARKGMTLEQIEAQEGGPVKESLTGMAQTKRAERRKGHGVGDTDLVDDVEGVEEELEAEEEDGVKLEAFNLKEERQRGYFDAAGNYVEREEKEEEGGKDAWLESEGAKVVDEKTRRRIQEQQRRMAEAEAEGPPTAVQLARLQWQVAQALQPGETVARALKRLGGHSKRPATRIKRGAGAAQPAAPQPAIEAGAKERFDRLTEAATALMDAGEADVYSCERSYFERAASVYIDVGDEDDAGPSSLLASGPSKAAYEGADEDMFAEEAAAVAEVPKAAAGSSKRKRVEDEDATDYASWPVKELRRFLTERGEDSAGIVDKADLVGRVRQAAERGAEAQAPAGYTYDPPSKMWYSADSGLYWDKASGGFFNSGDGKWYSYSADGEWVEWPAGGAR